MLGSGHSVGTGHMSHTVKKIHNRLSSQTVKQDFAGVHFIEIYISVSDNGILKV